MATREVRIPKMGMSSTEVDVISLLVAAGDRVSIGSPLAEIESEKASFTIEADVAGTVVDVALTVGETADVGALVCRIEDGE